MSKPRKQQLRAKVKRLTTGLETKKGMCTFEETKVIVRVSFARRLSPSKVAAGRISAAKGEQKTAMFYITAIKKSSTNFEPCARCTAEKTHKAQSPEIWPSSSLCGCQSALHGAE